MGGWKRSVKRYYPQKKEFYSNLIMKSITDADYKCAKRV